MARKRSPGRREALLAAGEQVLAARGADGVTVEEVTAAAGVAKGTFYLYFRSKSELVGALRHRFAEDLAAAVAAQSADENRRDWPALVRQRLEAAADAFFGQGQRHEVLFHDDVTGYGSDSEPGWAQAIVGALGDLIRASEVAGAFTVSDPDLTAAALFHAIHGLFHHGVHHAGRPDRDRLLQAAWELVSRTLGVDVPHGPVSRPGAARGRAPKTGP